MALINGEMTSFAAGGFSNLPVTRQVGLLVGLAASIALGIAVYFWSTEPTYRPLFSQLNAADSAEVIDVLQRNNIPYKMNQNNGTILVAGNAIHNARLKLAAEGLPKSEAGAVDLMGKSNGFGMSTFMEAQRYKHMLERELSRTISNFTNVKSARVHLAMPKQTSFVRDRRQASASVFIDVYRGRVLSPSEIASIVHLVSSSIPNLPSNKVTVVDQNGTLLTEGSAGTQLAAANRMMMYRQQIENDYARRIQDLLTPILGVGKVKARVSADVDFTSSEQTREMFNPDQGALRSEQTFKEDRSAASGETAQGVPGALSNQPPQGGAAQGAGATNAETNAEATKQKNLRTQSTKNYELDKTISHTKHQPGQIKRLSIAVLVDNKMVMDEKSGEKKATPLSKEEIAKITTLVKNAVGFNASRGDTVNVINNAFAKPEPIEKQPEPKLWQQAWFMDIVKQASGALGILLLIFVVIRPIMKNLAKQDKQLLAKIEEQTAKVAKANAASGEEGGNGQLALGQNARTHEQRLGALQTMATENPKLVANVVKEWIDE